MIGNLTEKIDKKKKRQVNPILVVLLFLAVIFGLAFFLRSQIPWIDEQIRLITGSSEQTAGNSAQTGGVKGSVAIIGKVRELKRCGSWPIADVKLSANRGNPFMPKNKANSGTEATGTEAAITPLAETMANPTIDCVTVSNN